jgi:hypothetical protein
LSTDELSNIEFIGDRFNDNVHHLVESDGVPTLLPLDGESVPDCYLQASTEIVALTDDSVSLDAITQREQDVNPTATGRNLSNRKLQPVEVLTAAGEWIRGYFIDACVRIANLVGISGRFTLFNADGMMYTFVGQVRPRPSS